MVVLFLGFNSFNKLCELVVFLYFVSKVVILQVLHVFYHVELDELKDVIIHHNFLPIIVNWFHQALHFGLVDLLSSCLGLVLNYSYRFLTS